MFKQPSLNQISHPEIPPQIQSKINAKRLALNAFLDQKKMLQDELALEEEKANPDIAKLNTLRRSLLDLINANKQSIIEITKMIKNRGKLEVEFIPDLEKQIEAQKNIFQANNLIKPLSNNQLGITGFNQYEHEEYPFPTTDSINEYLSQNQEKYQRKAEQGFTRLQITPIISLDTQIKALEQVTLKHKDQLFAAKKDPAEETQKLTVNEDQPVLIWEEGYQNNADLNGDIIYYLQTAPAKLPNNKIEEYDQVKHGGFTKEELLAQSQNTPFPGYIVELKQADPKIPRQNTSQPLHDRAQLETNKTVRAYLTEIQTKPEYQGENLTTIDSEIINAILNLEQNQGVLRDWKNPNDAACFAAGTYFKRRGVVPDFGWNRDGRRFYVYRHSLDYAFPDYGVCASARLG